MAKQLNSKMKLCLVYHNGPILLLGGIAGPILKPCNIDLRKVVNMVQQGIRVIEVNPKNHKETVELSIQNVMLDNFPEKPKFKMPEEVKKVEIPVVKKEDVIVATQENNIDKFVEEKNNENHIDVTYPDVVETTLVNEVIKEDNTSDIVEVKEKKYDKPYKNDFNKKHHKK